MGPDRAYFEVARRFVGRRTPPEAFRGPPFFGAAFEGGPLAAGFVASGR